MSQSKLPPKVLGAAEAAAYKQMETFRQFRQNDHLHPWVAFRIGVVAGVEWLWSHLSEQADEFDETATENAAIQQANICINEYKSGKSLWAIFELAFRKGARWMFDQMKAREAALRWQLDHVAQTGAAVAKERDKLRADNVQLAAYVNRLLDRIVVLEKECGRDPGDY